jgi:hypothetical protein
MTTLILCRLIWRASELTDESKVPSSGVTAQVSSFGVIPKRHQPGKWQLILDLSSPQGRSVNDGISRDLCSFTYISVAESTSVVLSLGHGTLLAKSSVDTDTPGRSVATRNAMERPDVLRCHPTLWSSVGPDHFLGRC